MGDALYVNLFVASELNWKAKGVTIRQETDFPYAETSKITIAEGKGQFALNVRYPGWVKPGQFSVKVNGQPVSIAVEEGRCSRDEFPDVQLCEVSA